MLYKEHKMKKGERVEARLKLANNLSSETNARLIAENEDKIKMFNRRRR